MEDPIVSRGILNRLKAPSELALAERILEKVAASAEPPHIAASLAYSKPTPASKTLRPARDAFLEAVAMSTPAAKFAEMNRISCSYMHIDCDGKAAATAQVIRELRCDFKRYSNFYLDGRLLPLSVFLAALELPQSVSIQRRCYRFSPELFELRNEMIKEYLRIKRAIILQPRGSSSKAFRSLNGTLARESIQDRVTAESRFLWEAKLCQVFLAL